MNQQLAPPPPPTRKHEPHRTHTTPLTNTRLSRLIYILILLSGILLAYYGYRLVNPKRSMHATLLLLLSDQRRRSRHEDEEDSDEIRRRIEGLADILGIPSRELAVAVAEVGLLVHDDDLWRKWGV